MDLNSCGLPTLEGIDHANPASIRALAESVDAKLQSWSELIHQYKYPDTVCFRPSTDYGIPTGAEYVFDFNSMQACSWNPSSPGTFRPGIWLFGSTTTFVSFTGAGVTALRVSMDVADYRTSSFVSSVVTRYSADGFRCARGEENFNITGLVELKNPPYRPITPYMQLWGSGAAVMSASRSYLWAIRLRGNS